MVGQELSPDDPHRCRAQREVTQHILWLGLYTKHTTPRERILPEVDGFLSNTSAREMGIDQRHPHLRGRLQ